MINIKSDSRRIKKGDIFVALDGINSNGSCYIQNAIASGASKIVCKQGSFDVETINVTGIYPSVSSYFEALNDSALLIKIATRADTRFEAFEPWFTSNVVAVNKAQMNQENYQSVFEEEGISMILGNINIPGSETQESINFLYSEITFPEGD